MVLNLFCGKAGINIFKNFQHDVGKNHRIKKRDGYVARCPEVKPLTKENRQRCPWSNYANRWNCTLATTSPRKSIVPKTKPFGFWPLFGLGLSLENGHLKIASPAGTPSCDPAPLSASPPLPGNAGRAPLPAPEGTSARPANPDRRSCR